MAQHPAAEPPEDELKADAITADEPLPRQFGKYTLLRKVASGGMAELFLALHRSVAGFEKLVVIKRILPSMNQDKAFIDMLLHEARIAATLSHPNIVQIFDVGQIESKFFIAMEHIHGEDIRSIVRAMKKKNVSEFPLEHTLSIVLGVCAGLAYAHEKRDLDGKLLDIVHRDISPQNIVVTFTGDVKVVDFGIAKSGTQLSEDTKSGRLKGKVPYMSPEQAAGTPIDWRTDIFAAGVILFELTTGKRLFKGASEYETLKLICDRDYPLPSYVRPGYPPSLEHIVMRALAKDKDERYQSAREMQQDIEAFAREERVPVSQVSLSKWMQFLFEEKLAEQKEALQDVKQLADVIAAQHASTHYEGGTGTTATASVLPAATTPSTPPPPRRTAAFLALTAVALGGALGGVWYVNRTARARAIAQDATATTADAAAAAKEPEVRGSLDIKSNPAGCAIWIDGDLRDEATPAKIEGLPLGRELTVKLTKEGLEAYREKVTLTEQQASHAIAAEMKAGSVTLLVRVTPPPAIWIDGKQWKGDRNKIDGLSADEEHKIVLAADGYVPKTIQLVAKQGETKIIQETLLRGDPNREASARSGGASESGGGAAKVRVGSKGGFCNVTINGASLGPTPVEASVNAGNVRIVCKPADGPAQTQSVHVAAGETQRVSFKIGP